MRHEASQSPVASDCRENNAAFAAAMEAALCSGASSCASSPSLTRSIQGAWPPPSSPPPCPASPSLPLACSGGSRGGDGGATGGRCSGGRRPSTGTRLGARRRAGARPVPPACPPTSHVPFAHSPWPECGREPVGERMGDPRGRHPALSSTRPGRAASMADEPVLDAGSAVPLLLLASAWSSGASAGRCGSGACHMCTSGKRGSGAAVCSAQAACHGCGPIGLQHAGPHLRWTCSACLNFALYAVHPRHELN